MAISVFDIFKIGIGPSSSHTVGPMRAARMFARSLATTGVLPRVHEVKVELFGSLGATGKGHSTDTVIMLGLAGHDPETIDVDAIAHTLQSMRLNNEILIAGNHAVRFREADHFVFSPLQSLPYHPNAMYCVAFDAHGVALFQRHYYSVGGGFVVQGDAHGEAREEAPPSSMAPSSITPSAVADSAASPRSGTSSVPPANVTGIHPPALPDMSQLPRPFRSGADLLRLCEEHHCSIADLMRVNEAHWRPPAEVEAGLARIWSTMQACVKRGMRSEGRLPGVFKVPRRAPGLRKRLDERAGDKTHDPLIVLDYVNLYALAVNEENAAGGRVVTAPTNGAAGIVPAVLHYYINFVQGSTTRGVEDFLLTAAALGILYKENASISGAEVGCQGEVGVACSMAAGALCAVLGGTPEQVENAAEIGMEHHLGLTCDPVGGLVQIPCIERNAIASVKAINAARMALHGDGTHLVSLDQVIQTMKETGADMLSKYKETSRGGLAVNIIEC